MSKVHGKGTAILLDNTAGALTNIRPYSDSVDGLPGEIEMSDVTPFGEEGHRNIPGLENASVSVSGSYDGDPAAISGIIGTTAQRKAATRSLEYGPAGSATGAIKYLAEVWITNFTITSAVADKVSWSATLQVDGTVSQGTFA
jgi:hypothetical protein